MDDNKTINDCLFTLDELALRYEGLTDILTMLSDSANDGAFSADSYKAGFWFISMIADEQATRLTKIKDTLMTCIKKELSSDV